MLHILVIVYLWFYVCQGDGQMCCWRVWWCSWGEMRQWLTMMCRAAAVLSPSGTIIAERPEPNVYGPQITRAKGIQCRLCQHDGRDICVLNSVAM